MDEWMVRGFFSTMIGRGGLAFFEIRTLFSSEGLGQKYQEVKEATVRGHRL